MNFETINKRLCASLNAEAEGVTLFSKKIYFTMGGVSRPFYQIPSIFSVFPKQYVDCSFPASISSEKSAEGLGQNQGAQLRKDKGKRYLLTCYIDKKMLDLIMLWMEKNSLNMSMWFASIVMILTIMNLSAKKTR